MTLAHGGSVPDVTAPPSAESLARAADDVANAATLLASLTRRSGVAGDAAHRARFVANVPPRLGGDLTPTTVREREAVEMLRDDA